MGTENAQVMNVLIVTHYYPPEPHRLIEELAGTLKEFGHTVRVLTGFPNWPSGRLHPDYPLRFLRKENLSGVEVYRTPVYPDHSRSVFKRTLNLVSFAISASLLGPFVVPRCDVVWVISPPTVALPGWLLSAIWKVPVVYDVLDMWPETLAATQMLGSSWVVSAVGWGMKKLYDSCAAIRVVSPGFQSDLIRKGVAPEKICYVPNWVDTDVYSRRAHNCGCDESKRRANKFRIVYAGNIGIAQGLDVVLDAAELLRANTEIEFVLIGDGVDYLRLRRVAEARQLENVRFLGRRPTTEMPEVYAEADVLLVHLRDEPIFRITIPHKILEYLASGKPIIAAVSGSAAEVVRFADAGIICEPSNAGSLAEAVTRMIAMPEGERLDMGRNARNAACKDYSRLPVVRKLEGILLKAVKAHRRPSPAGRSVL